MSDSYLPPVLDKLSTLEEAIIDASRRGTWVQPDIRLTAGELTTTEDPRLRVRAELIRELLMGRRGELDPRGTLIRGVRVIGHLKLDHVTAVTGLALVSCALLDGITCHQARLRQVTLSGSVISTLNAAGVRTDGSFSACDAHITGTSEDGTLRLLDAHIGGQLDLDRVTITNTAGPALIADSVRTDARFSVCDAHITGTGEDGALRLLGAHIGGQLIFDRATITNTTGPALDADDVRTDSRLSACDAHISGVSADGAFRLLGAHIGGQLDLDQVTITNTAGPALDADNVRIDTDLFVRDAHITGTGEYDSFRLPGTHIGGQLDLDRVTITNATGPALNANDVRVKGDLFLREAHISGISAGGAFRLHGAHIDGQFDLTRTQIVNKSGPLFTLEEAQVNKGFFFPAALVCSDSRQEFGDRTCPEEARSIIVQGFIFTQLRQITWREWLHLLVHHTPEYLPQPYQQLAAVERAAGHDNNARTILITQQHDLRRRAPGALGGTLARARHWLWGWLGRYGYRAHRLVTALLISLVLAGATGYTAGQITTRPHHHAAERVQPSTIPITASGIPCSTAELIGLGIDRGLPVGATGLRARCDLDTATRWGQVFTYLLWALQALLWALATLTIAAYTGLIRKTT